MLQENFRFIFNEYKKGNARNYQIIADEYLHILIDELMKISNLDDDLINKALLAFLNGIKTFSFEKAASFENFIRSCINISMQLKTEELVPKIDFSFLFDQEITFITPEKLNEYLIKIKEKLSEKDGKSNVKLIKLKKI